MRELFETEIELRPIEPATRLRSRQPSTRAATRRSTAGSSHRTGRLTEAELRHLTEVDHRDHEALLAVDPASGTSVDAAR
jgi:hypothetical protein